MGNKKKCDNPFNCHKSKVFGSNVSADILADAAKLHPNIDWKVVNILCVACRKKAAATDVTETNPKKIRKISSTASSHAIAVTSSGTSSDTSSNDEREMQIDHTQENLLEVGMEYNIGIQNDEQSDDETQHPPSQVAAAEDPSQSSSAASCPNSSSQATQSSVATYVADANRDMEILELNAILKTCGLNSLSKTTFYHSHALRGVFNDMISALDKKFQHLFKGESSLELERALECGYCETLFNELCVKFHATNQRAEKYKILTSLPGKYNLKQITDGTGCTTYMAKKAVDLRCELGVFSTPDPRQGNKLPDRLVNLVKAYYLDSSHSRPSPRANDTIRGPNNTRLAKHHMLLNQRDMFSLFKLDHPNEKIGITSFLSLCPKECRWPWYKPFHNVCLCITHQNFKLLYDAIRGETPFPEFIQTVFCNPIGMECAFGLCNECPKTEFIAELFAGMDDNELIQYKEWTRQDGTNFEIVATPVHELVEKFEQNIMRYIDHDFVNDKQKKFINHVKTEDLKNNKILLIQVDFAQNYGMVVQDSVYGFHWSRKQATLHPFSVTWWDPVTKALKERNYVVLSDTLDHDADTFNSFKRKVITRIKEDFADFDPTHIIYLSDGAGGQYKNKKNMAHLMKHFEDFQMTAEWMFTASSHGKGPCDRVAATVKRTTRVNSLKPGVIITDAMQMFEFCVSKLQSETLFFIYVSNDEIEAERDIFLERYAEFQKSIPGTRAFHHFTPLDDGKLCLQKFSGSNERHTFDFKKDSTPLVDPNDLEIGHFYCFVEALEAQVGMLVDVDDDEVEFQCMRINKGNRRCKWPKISVTRRVTTFDVILILAEPMYHPDGYFMLLPEEKVAMKERLKLYKKRI